MAVGLASLDWGKLDLRAGFWQHGRRPRDLMDLTPYEFQYLLTKKEVPPDRPGFFDTVLKSVVRNNEKRGRDGKRPILVATYRDVIANREE